jgi:outer membrane protein assembly factor BamB
MRRISVIGTALLVLGLAASAQMWPQRVDPKTDPKAFMIITQANLDDALTRINRLRVQLKDVKDKDEREFLINAILEICQAQLNEDRNDSGVIVVERTDQLVYTTSYDGKQTVDESESVYDLPIRWQGAFSAIEAQIRALGKEGLDQYEKDYGARATLLLGQAIETRQRDRIQYLNRRFGLTRAGIRAGILLATMYWEEGHISQAARYLERVLALTELLSTEDRAGYSAWLAHCYRDLGERANLVRLIEQTVSLRESEIDEGGAKVKLGELLQRRLLEARDATTDTIDKLGVEWPGGNYTNTGLHEQPSDYRQIAWSRILPSLGATPHWQRFMNYPMSHVPPYLPLFDGDMFYVNTGDRLAAYDLISDNKQATAKPAWFCKPFDTTTSNWRVGEPDPGLILPVSMYRGTVFTAIENPLSQKFHDPNPDPNFQLWSHYPKVRRALCAIDGSSGRLLWKIGGQYEGDDLETVNFLSAVVHEGTLYAIASRAGHFAEIFVYAINPNDGEVLWNLRLCYGQQETTMFGRPAREPHPSLPCFAAGRMFLCTNIGGVVSVELATRSLSWISRYEYIPRPTTKYLATYYRDVTWYNSPTIYTEYKGKSYLVVAPTDSRKMFALDAHTGRILWGLFQDRDDDQPSKEHLEGGRALVGVRDGQVFIASDGGDQGGSRSRLHTVSLEKGRIEKSTSVTPADAGNVLALGGRPCIAANRLLWPGFDFNNKCTIAEIDLDKLRVVGSAYASNSYEGCNVFAQHGVVFTVSGRDYTRGNSQFAAHFNKDSLLEAAREDYKNNPDKADTAVRYGLLVMRLGNREEALTALKRAFEIASQVPPDTRTRDQAGRALVQAWLELADKALGLKKYTEALGHVQNARAYATGRGQLSDCFAIEERALLAEGRADDIEAFYRGLIDEDPDFGVGADPEIPVGLYARIRLAERLEFARRDAEAADWWQEVQQGPERLTVGGKTLRALALDRLRNAIKRSGRGVYAKQDAKAAELAAEATTDSRGKLLRLYPLATAADEAALELAQARIQAFYPEEGAEILRNALDENSDRPRASEMNALLALCFSASGERLRARLLATRILREHPNGELTVGGKTRLFKDVLKPLLQSEDAESDAAPLPRLPQQVSPLWSRPWDATGFVLLPPQPVSMDTPRFHIGETTQSDVQLVSLDASTGEPAWSDQVPVSVSGVFRTRRGTLFVQRQGFSLYDDDGNVQWSNPASGIVFEVSLSGGMLVYNTLSTISGKSFVHVCARDVDSGGLVWEKDVEGSSARWIAQCPQGVLITVLGNETYLVLLNAESGAEIARHVLGTESRITAAPAVTEDHVAIVDRDGKLTKLSLADLKPTARFETKVRYPTMLRIIDGDYLIVGLTSVGRFKGADAKVVWTRDYAENEVVTAQTLMKDAIAIGTRTTSDIGRITAYSLKDGKPTFTYEVPRRNESDRVSLQNTVAFDGGLVVVFTDRRIIDGRMQIWGFRLLVLNADGSERFTWEHEKLDAPPYVQLALTDNFIALTAD